MSVHVCDGGVILRKDRTTVEISEKEGKRNLVREIEEINCITRVLIDRTYRSYNDIINVDSILAVHQRD